MKKQASDQPILSIAEMLEIDSKRHNYAIPCGGVSPIDLLRAFGELHSGVDRCLLVRYGASWFVFECGRIYGIRQERARRRACRH